MTKAETLVAEAGWRLETAQSNSGIEGSGRVLRRRDFTTPSASILSKASENEGKSVFQSLVGPKIERLQRVSAHNSGPILFECTEIHVFDI